MCMHIIIIEIVHRATHRKGAQEVSMKCEGDNTKASRALADSWEGWWSRKSAPYRIELQKDKSLVDVAKCFIPNSIVT